MPSSIEDAVGGAETDDVRIAGKSTADGVAGAIDQDADRICYILECTIWIGEIAEHDADIIGYNIIAPPATLNSCRCIRTDCVVFDRVVRRL